MIRTKLVYGCSRTPRRIRPLHPTRRQFTLEASQTQACTQAPVMRSSGTASFAASSAVHGVAHVHRTTDNYGIGEFDPTEAHQSGLATYLPAGRYPKRFICSQWASQMRSACSSVSSSLHPFATPRRKKRC